MADTLTGTLVVITGASGAGKSSIVAPLANLPGTARLVTWTTRPPRPHERDGRDYFFTTAEKFKERIAAEAFFEHAVVYGNHYGSAWADLETSLAANRVTFAIIDVQGARTLKARLGERCVIVFIEPRPFWILAERIAERSATDPAEAARRIATAESEIAAAHEFDHVVVNEEGKLRRAIRDCYKIISPLL